MIRDYSAADLDRIFHLDEVCFDADFRFDRESMRMFAEATDAIALVAEDGAAEIIGFVVVHVERIGARRRGYVVTLDVAPAWRRTGVAGRLMDEVQRRVGSAGAGWMELHVFTGNESAIRFYEGRGFERVGMQRGFYGGDGRGLDAFLYRRALR